MVKPLQYMLIYIYLSIMLLCSNQHCVLNTYSGSRKLPDYLILTSHVTQQYVLVLSVSVKYVLSTYLCYLYY